MEFTVLHANGMLQCELPIVATAEIERPFGYTDALTISTGASIPARIITRLRIMHACVKTLPRERSITKLNWECTDRVEQIEWK